ncbi:hypothetical protein DM860_009446 [Cuscuta australis]|uniref:Ubiquitin thioesterase OTU n=1 Tax=Cuscuta australis TaxID=267555 RepID=A0A328DIG5_9ASTE|nr:hypothetical protein DM860_009446 [Cuscuta australis]
MLGTLCARRPKPWLSATLSLYRARCSTAAVRNRLSGSPIRPVLVHCDGPRRLRHSNSCRFGSVAAERGGSRSAVFHRRDCQLGKVVEGSWNARPARWLRNPDSALLLFGGCPCWAAPPLIDLSDSNPEAAVPSAGQADKISSDSSGHTPSNYRVTGVAADGRCLFRAIAHVACLRSGGEAPDENRQRELADELRANVVNELLQRQKEAEWFIEGDFDAYIKSIEKPYEWGGEPELLMASHVLKTPISVYMIDKISKSLINISSYGEEYGKAGENPIKILFHGYGHYDILETDTSS